MGMGIAVRPHQYPIQLLLHQHFFGCPVKPYGIRIHRAFPKHPVNLINFERMKGFFASFLCHKRLYPFRIPVSHGTKTRLPRKRQQFIHQHISPDAVTYYT